LGAVAHRPFNCPRRGSSPAIQALRRSRRRSPKLRASPLASRQLPTAPQETDPRAIHQRTIRTRSLSHQSRQRRRTTPNHIRPAPALARSAGCCRTRRRVDRVRTLFAMTGAGDRERALKTRLRPAQPETGLLLPPPERCSSPVAAQSGPTRGYPNRHTQQRRDLFKSRE